MQINKYAFSGGRVSAEEQRQHGANVDIDVSYLYLTFFLDDDEKLKQVHDVCPLYLYRHRLDYVRQDYKSGKLLTGEVKAILIGVLQELVQKHQDARTKVTEEVVDAFMQVRSMHFQPPTPPGLVNPEEGKNEASA